MTDTRQRLLDGAFQTLRDQGMAATSARAIAATAGVNQALIFYHFGSVNELLVTSCREATAARVELYRPRLDELTSLRDLLALGRELHEAELAAGNVTVLAQVLSGAQHSAVLAEVAAEALGLWISEIERVLSRVLRDSPIAAALDVPGLARAVAVTFIGAELYERADPSGVAAIFGALDQIAVLTDVIDDLGPVARRALNSRMRRSGTRRSRTEQG